jgi:serine protease AprX
MFILAVPLAASASQNGGSSSSGTDKTYVAPELRNEANAHPNKTVSVIITSNSGVADASKAFRGLGVGKLHRSLGLIDGVAVTLPAKMVDRLRDVPGLTVTVDSVVKTSGRFSSKQMWPYEAGNAALWERDGSYASSMPTIAVVDSGIQPGRVDVAGRVLANVKFSSLPNDSAGDGRGHGTFVAGIAAGAADGYAGASPTSNLVNLDVMNDDGQARTSDVIAAANWIIQNKAQYNIRVANFSLHSGRPSNFTNDPLDKAVEKLWFSGVVVVAAAGNYGLPTGPSGVKYAPGNDPFVITVGAADLGKSPSTKDDTVAPWSAWGRTYDGFMKPEIVADGRYMIGPVPVGSSLAILRADKLVAPGYIQLSGTSFSTPVIAGGAAQILARHPSWTPDQVKGALMATARKVAAAPVGSAGVGEVTINRAAEYDRTPPNPNRALDKFVVADPTGGQTPVFDSASWKQAASGDVSWDQVSWEQTAWGDVSWDLSSWAAVSYDDVSYSDVSYSDVSYDAVSYSDVSYEDAAEGDTAADPAALELTPDALAAIAADPMIAPPADTLSAAAAVAGIADPTVTAPPPPPVSTTLP